MLLRNSEKHIKANRRTMKSKNKTIMIVEDDDSFHNLYESILEDTDYRIIHAYDGNDALERLEEETPDLIILDVVLDMMTGDTFFLYLKGNPEHANIPVIIASGYPIGKFKNLKVMDPRIALIEKSSISDILIKEIDARIG